MQTDKALEYNQPRYLSFTKILCTARFILLLSPSIRIYTNIRYIENPCVGYRSIDDTCGYHTPGTKHALYASLLAYPLGSADDAGAAFNALALYAPLQMYRVYSPEKQSRLIPYISARYMCAIILKQAGLP